MSEKNKFKTNKNNKVGKYLKEISSVIKKNDDGVIKLKTKNKKEKKILKAGCPHHYISKKGKPKMALKRYGDIAKCKICGAEFKTKFYSDEQINDIVGNFKEVNNQAKFISVSMGFGGEATDYFGDVGVTLSKYSKTYAKMRNASMKSKNIEKKKNKDKDNGFHKYGSWNTK